MARNVAHTSASVNVDGKGTTGGNNVMERGGSVVANPIWEPAQPQSPRQRFYNPKYANISKMNIPKERRPVLRPNFSERCNKGKYSVRSK